MTTKICYFKDRICFSTTALKHDEINYIFHVYSINGLNNIEFNLEPLMKNQSSIEDVLEYQQENNINIRMLSGGWCDFFHEWPEIEETFISIDRQVEISGYLKCPSIRVFFGRKKYNEFISNTFDNLVENIQHVSDKHRHVNFYFENHDGASLLPEFCLDAISSVNRENVKINFDPVNFEKAGFDSLHAYELLKGHIFHVHLKGIRNKEYCRYGCGEVNLDYIISDLISSEYDNLITLEYEGGKEPVEQLVKSKMDFQEKWGLI